MKTEEKVMTFSHNTTINIGVMRESLNKELKDGWKIKPATFYDIMNGKCLVVCLYREAEEKQTFGPGLP